MTKAEIYSASQRTIADQGLTVPKGTDLRKIYNPTRHILYLLYINSDFDLLGDDTR